MRALILVALSAVTASAQTQSDGFMMTRHAASGGIVYTRETWHEYWEGTLKRENGNIGHVTTQSLSLVSSYGVTDRLNVMAAVPYIWSHVSEGVLSDMSGVQDLSLAAKYNLLNKRSEGRGSFNAFVGIAGSIPLSDYTPDFLPLSIGTGGGRAAGRFTLSYNNASPWFVSASSAYTWCSNVKLNRNSYYTSGQLYLTNEVAMPNVLENSVSAGYRRGRLHIPLSLTQQRTLGGDDIRRQDMPFVSNRMDFLKLDAGLMFALPVPGDLSIKLGAGHVLTGRNVGQSTTFTSGLFYAPHF